MKAKLRSQVQSYRLPLEKAIPLATPLVIYLEPSGFCNLKCGFCPHGFEGNHLKKDIMSLELFKKLIDDLSQFREKIKLLRICGNGDPLMNKALLAMLEHANQQKLVARVELITNGILLTSKLIKNMPRLLDRIVFSIEGLGSDDYMRICHARVDFKKLLRNIETLYRSKHDCVVHVKIHHEAVRTPERKNEFMTTFGGLCDEIFIEKLVPMWPQLESKYSSSEFRWGANDVIKRNVCAQIFKGMQVQADGEVVPCCVDWKRINVLGDIRHETLHDIWNGPKLRQLQMEHLGGHKRFLEPCKDCVMNDYCEVDNLDAHVMQCMEKMRMEAAL